MTLRHTKGNSKLTRLKGNNENSRQAISEQLSIKQKLLEKMGNAYSSEEDEVSFFCLQNGI